MTRLLFSLSTSLLFTAIVFAQAALPTSDSFTTTALPDGWTSSGTGSYASSGNTPPAMKFDGTGDVLTIWFAESASRVNYYMRGNSFSGGTFSVEESEDGLSWTPTQVFTTLTGGYAQYIQPLDPESRYVRFIYTLKVSGNVGLDDVSIAPMEPATQATELAFSTIKTYRFKGNFTGTDCDGYLVLRKKGSQITAVPSDGNTYVRGDVIGDAQVVSSGAELSFIPNHIEAGSVYHFAIFTYNGSGAQRNYLTINPLKGSVTTPATMLEPGLYTNIHPASTSFVDELHQLVNPHTQLSYGDYIPLLIDRFESRDTIGDQRVLTCIYSGQNLIYTPPFEFTANNFSREHTYCHSWMPTNPAQELPEYSDFHHLFPANQNDANGVRSNYPLGEVVDEISTFGGSRYGLNLSGQLVFEPRDEHKGDAARALMYEAICYQSVEGNNWGFLNPISAGIPYGQDPEILRLWHFQDQPDGWEIARNDYIDSLQGNRNPFIDHPEYACYIDFSNMTYRPDGCSTALEKKTLVRVTAYPNPASHKLTLRSGGGMIKSYEIKDTTGKTVMTGTGESEKVSLSVGNLPKGRYTIHVQLETGETIAEFVVN